MVEKKSDKQRMRTFFIIWFGQFVSTLGSGLTGFALGVYVYQQTQSTTLFAINILAYMIPGVFFSPVAGALVDRWNRRWAMILADTGAGLSTLAIFLLLRADRLEIWHIFIATFMMSMFTSFQWPAYSAATTMLVPKEHLGRAGGMVQIGEALSQLISPAIAGALFVAWGMQGVVMVDVVTFLFAVLTLLVVVIPEPKREEKTEEEKVSIWADMKVGWQFIMERKGLLYLLLYFASINFAGGFMGPLITPMMLEMGTPDQVGYVSSSIGVGMLVGTLIMSAWGGPKKRVYGILGGGLWSGLFVLLLGTRPSLLLIAIVGFFYMISMPIINGSSQALWQTKTPPDMQGRVFSVRRMIAQFTSPVAIIMSGPLVDYVMQPALDTGGALASTAVGQMIGSGPGSGAALMFVLIGLMAVAFSLIGLALPALRNVQENIPDVEVIEEGSQGAELVEEAVPAAAD